MERLREGTKDRRLEQPRLKELGHEDGHMHLATWGKVEEQPRGDCVDSQDLRLEDLVQHERKARKAFKGTRRGGGERCVKLQSWKPGRV